MCDPGWGDAAELGNKENKLKITASISVDAMDTQDLSHAKTALCLSCSSLSCACLRINQESQRGLILYCKTKSI